MTLRAAAVLPLLLVAFLPAGGCRKTATTLRSSPLPGTAWPFRRSTSGGDGFPRAQSSRALALADRDELARRTILSPRPAALLAGEVRDAATGGALRSRVLVTDGGCTEPGALLGSVGFWCEGSFRLPVLPGVARVRVSAGRRRSMAARELHLKPGRRARVRVDLLRPPVLRFEERGWVGVDLFRPLAGGNALRRKATLDLLALAARAEGVAFVGAAAPWPPREGVPWQDIELRALRECAELSGDGLTIAPVERGNDCPLYGSMFVLAEGKVAEELRAGRRRLWDPSRPNFVTTAEAHARGGIAVLYGIADARELDPRADIVAIRADLKELYGEAAVALGGVASELPFDIVAGVPPDALALSGSAAEFDVWFRLLEMGCRLPAVHVERGSFAAGIVPAERTFVQVPAVEDGGGEIGAGKPPTVENVIAAIRTGRVMASNGAFVFLTIGGRGPGAVFRADGRPRPVSMEAFSSTLRGDEIHTVEFLRKGKVVESIPGQGRTMIAATFAVKEAETAWYIARVRSGPEGGRVAWTSPVYFEGPQHSRPRPVKTRVRGRVTDAATETPLAAAVRAYMNGKPVAEAASDPKTGEYEITCSPAAMLEARAEGHAPESARVFFHTNAPQVIKAIHTDEWGRGASVLAEKATYERMRLASGEAEIDFALGATTSATEAQSTRETSEPKTTE